MLKPRTITALRRAHDAGLHVIVVTGRMFRSAARSSRQPWAIR